MGFCTICNKTQPVVTEPGKGKGQWEETGAEDSSRRLTVFLGFSSLFGFMHTPGFPHEAPWHSPCFLYFCDFQKQISGLCLIWGKHCVSTSSAFAPWAVRRCVECPLLAEWGTPTNTLNTGWNNRQTTKGLHRLIPKFNAVKCPSYIWPNQNRASLLQVSATKF